MGAYSVEGIETLFCRPMDMDIRSMGSAEFLLCGVKEIFSAPDRKGIILGAYTRMMPSEVNGKRYRDGILEKS